MYCTLWWPSLEAPRLKRTCCWEKPSSCGFSVFVCSCVKWQQQCVSGGPSSVVISVLLLQSASSTENICIRAVSSHMHPTTNTSSVFKQLSFFFYADVTNAYAWFHGAAPSFPRTSEGNRIEADLSADDRQAMLESHIRLLLLRRGGGTP